MRGGAPLTVANLAAMESTGYVCGSTEVNTPGNPLNNYASVVLNGANLEYAADNAITKIEGVNVKPNIVVAAGLADNGGVPRPDLGGAAPAQGAAAIRAAAPNRDSNLYAFYRTGAAGGGYVQATDKLYVVPHGKAPANAYWVVKLVA
jgi:hypothetical protein